VGSIPITRSSIHTGFWAADRLPRPENSSYPSDASKPPDSLRNRRVSWQPPPSLVLRLKKSYSGPILSKAFTRCIFDILDAFSDLRASRDYAEHLLEVADVVLLVLGTDGCVERINRKGCEVLGRPLHTILGRDWFSHFLPEDIRQETRRIFDRMVSGEEKLVRHHDNPVLTASGRTRLISWHNALLRDAGGGITGVLSSGLDITAQRQQTEALRLYERIVSDVPDYIAVVDRDYVYRMANKACIRFHGRWREESEGHSVAELFGSELFESTIKPKLDRCFAGEVVHYEGWFDIPGVGRRYQDVVYTPYIEHDGTVGGAIVGARDTTDLYLAQVALRESEEHNRTILDTAADGILAVDEGGRMVYANRALCGLVGYGDEELRGQPVTLLMPERYRGRHEAAFGHYLHTGHPSVPWRDRAVVLRHRDGHEISVELSIAERCSEDHRLFIGVIRDMTEHRRVEQALLESQERYRSLFEHMLHGYAYCAMLFEEGTPRDFVYLDVNPAFETLTGLKDVVGKKVSEVIPGIREGNPELFEIYGRVALTGEPERFETYMEALDIWFSISVYSPAKEHFVAVFDNITERKKAEVALRDSEARYKALFHGNSDAIFLHGILPSGEPDRFEKVNEAACRHLGYSEAELLNLSPKDIDAGGMDEQRLAAIRSLMTEGQAVFEMEHVAKDGRRIPLEINSRIIDIQGRPMVLSMARDVTERRQSLQALKSHQEHIRMLLDSMAEGMYGVDTSGSCTFVNQAFLKIMGYNREEDLLGRHIHEMIHHSHADSSPYPQEQCRAYRAYVENRECHVDDEVFWRTDGTSFPVEYWSYPMRRNGEIVGSVVTFQDISDRRRAKEKLHAARQMLENVIDTVPQYVFWKDRECRYLGCNTAFARSAGLSRSEDIVGMNDYDMVWRRFADLYRRDDMAVMETQTPKYNIIEPVHMANRGDRWLSTSKVPLRNSQSQVIGVLGVYEDITERLKSEEKLRQAAKVFESTMEGVVITDPDGAIVAVNPAFTDITGYMEAEVLGKNPRIRKSGRHDASFYQAMWASIHQTGSWRGEIWNRRKNGEVYPEWLTINTVKNEAGDTTNFVAVFTDISHMKRSEAELDFLAHHDPLTELPNRLLLGARLEHAIQRAQRENSILAVLFIDLDRFKTVNDSLGHPIGDQLLRIVAGMLTECVRNEDSVARLGGDEFVVVLEGLGDTGSASDVAEKILNTLAKPFELDGNTVFVGASIGISTYPEDGRDGMTLLKNADAAMYRSKEEGRNTFRYYSAELTRKARDRLTLETALRHGIEQQEFVLHFQPQVDVASGAVVGAEALVRWDHPQSGLISPLRFIPIAEETGLILPLGDWVLHAACEQLQHWLASGLPPITLAVNLSPRQFQQRDLLDRLRAVFEATGLPPHLLELEITESAIMEQGEKARSTLHALKSLGVKLAIDDFGTGYSSLAYLRRFPINVLKIDQSFMRDIPHDTSAMEIAATIIAMARNLHLRVLAEGVETEEQLAFLQSRGCDVYQGFLHSRPMPREEFERHLRSGEPPSQS
jgi:diguanylate cyclase (GGDEF)-like protein/PAS domain S-box-containing protein